MSKVNESKKYIEKQNAFLVISLFLLSLLLPNVFSIIGVGYPVILQLLVELVVLLSCINIYKEDFKNSFIKFKKSWLKYIFMTVGITALIIFLNTLLNSIIMNTFNVSIPNKTLLYQVQEQTPIYWILSVLLISPIMETLVIPVSFYHLLNNNKLCFLLLSSFLYGLFYVIFSIKVPLQALYIISYGVVGAAISLTYYKNNNICLPLIIKFLYALFTVLIFVL